jgi:F0F1-type ATP synthase beta subunit
MAALGIGADDEDQSKLHPHPTGNPPGTLNPTKIRGLTLRKNSKVVDSAEIDIEEEEEKSCPVSAKTKGSMYNYCGSALNDKNKRIFYQTDES